MKRCTGPCGEEKPLDAFARHRGRRDGHQSWCRVCKAAERASRKASKRAAGLCDSCPAPAAPGRTLCEAHAATHAAREASRKAAKKAAGLCRDCATPVAPDHTLCETHAAAYAVRNAARRAAKKAAGLCWNCPEPAVPGNTCCETHRADKATREAARYADNPEKARASNAVRARKSREAAKAEGRCCWKNGYGCDQPAEEGRVFCPTHRSSNAASHARRSARQTAAMLADCAELDIYRCHLCELPILPDDEMHRDHLVPVAHGGADRCEATGTTMLRPAHAYCNVSRQDDHVLVAVSRLNPGVAS